MKITLAQLNPFIGDIEGNVKKAFASIDIAYKNNADLIVFSEMYICGYPPRDLLKRSGFVEKSLRGLEEIKKISRKYKNLGIVIGGVDKNVSEEGFPFFNTAFFISNGKVLFKKNKSLLPTYDVFDERRYFEPDYSNNVFEFKGKRIGLLVCEDAWKTPVAESSKYYKLSPSDIMAKKGTDIFINISASPFHIDKEKVRYKIAKYHIRKYKKPFVFVNQVGGNDELVFDGQSFVMNEKGDVICFAGYFNEKVKSVDLNKKNKIDFFIPDKIELVYDALVAGLRDYVRKCGFKKVILGLSGGIDSSVVCAMAVDAVGKNNVVGVAMPSKYSSSASVEDAKVLAENLGVKFKVININSIFQEYLDVLSDEFRGTKEDVTEENIQPRIRGNILMSLSNKFGYLVLSTGNKSELSVGYCTLYGDMTGGLSVISDVPKTMVYKLARHINKKYGRYVIPKRVLRKAPSAELKPNQKDEDSLPKYSLLDKIIKYYVDEKLSVDEIIEKGFDERIVKWVAKTVDKNEYKRRQAPPGIKISSKAFGIGRRMPIAAKYF